MTDERLKALETNAAEIRFRIKKTALEMSYNCEQMKAGEINHHALKIAEVCFKLKNIEDQIARENYKRAFSELNLEREEAEDENEH